ncbi:MAG: DUF11 domain-containing protein [Pseudomonadales bacterium]|nr:DUF11 domain-containing protein [Pseudomonadales bacterium]
MTLNAGIINSGIWVTRDASFEGERVIEAELSYAGASTGSIGIDTITINLLDGAAGAQYLPFNFNLASPLVLLTNTSIILKITNNTTVFGESINIHTIHNSINPTQVALNAASPLTIEAIEVFDNDIDLGGVLINSASPGMTIWVRATVQDPFGSADITSASLTITDPLSTITLPAASMSVPTIQPASGAQKYFQLSHVLSGELGDWNLSVVAQEGTEGSVSASDSVLFNINNNLPTLTDSFKTVSNLTTGSNANTNEGNTLRYTIELIETGGANATSVSVTDTIPANTTFVPGSLTIDSVVQADPGATINLSGLTVPALSSMTIEFDVTVDIPTSTGSIISNTANVTNPNGVVTSIDIMAEDIVIAGSPASGTKFIYLENLNSTPIITRLEPQIASGVDVITLSPEGGSVDMDLPLAGGITLDPADHPGGNVIVRFRVSAAGAFFGFRQIRGTFGYHNGGSVTPLGTITQNFNLTGAISTQILSIPLSVITSIPAGNQLRLTISNITTAFFGTTPNITVSSFDGGGGGLRSHMEIVPSPVINVDSISFWSDTMGAGVEVTNPDPNGVDVDIYAKIVISDPFGDSDIQAPDAATNASVVTVVDPDGNATLDASVLCTAPCYAYDGEDLVNDPPGDATRTFYYIIRIDSDPPATRGTWTVQVTANEGLETGVISHTLADGFTTLSQSNLSTSTKNWSHAGDVDPGETLTYTITLINTGGQDADNVIFSDTLATSPVSLSFSSASTTCLDESAAALPAPSFSGGVVSLSNISVLTGGSCLITINSIVGAGNPGDLINNIATITNPVGPGANPVAPTIILSQSQIATIGSKQLYLDNLAGAASLGRTQPNAISEATILPGATLQVNYSAGTQKQMVLETGTIALSLRLRKTGGGFNSNMNFQFFVDANDGSGFVSVDSVAATFFLGGTAQTIVLSLTNSVARTLNIGSQFRLEITNTGGGTTVFVSQVSSAPYSEIQLPVSGALEVTSLTFFDLSGNDAGGCAPNCGTEILPAGIVIGGSIWARALITDAFGSFDVNTGCDGITTVNCPSITITDPTSGDQTPVSPANELTFLTAADPASRTYEFEITPAGFGLEGLWQIEVLGKEGTEGAISDTAISTFELFGMPLLTVLETFSGTASPGLIITYNNDVNNSGSGPAINVELTNDLSDFIVIELVESGGNWTSQFSITAPFSINTESFDSGDDTFTYIPTLFCGAAIPSNSPCFDPTIVKWRVLLNEQLPVGDSLNQEYRARIE